MKNQRLYYQDAYTTKFTALVMGQVEVNGRQAVLLDRSYFYPTSGGQPHDMGILQGTPVVEVTVRETDGAVLHWFDGEGVEGEVTAVIDWDRRFDHMQQHTGQHILSQAFMQIAEAKTISFHLSQESATIDLDIEKLSQEQLADAELLANETIWQNRPIQVRTITLAEAERLPLRKIPPTQDGKLRIIDIDQFDLNACGGTHVANTGEVGAIKIIKKERRRDKLRIEFCCGARALRDYHLKHQLMNDLTTLLTTGYEEIPPAVERLQEELKQMRRQLRQQEAALTAAEIERLLMGARQVGDTAVITQVFTDHTPAQLRVLSSQLTGQGGVVVFVWLGG